MSAAGGASALVETTVWKIQQGQGRRESDLVAQEALLQLVINGKLAFHLLYLPGQEIELALGFLLCRGVIEGSEDLKEIRLIPAGSNPEQMAAQVRLQLGKSFEPQRDLSLTTVLALAARQPVASLTARQFQGRPGGSLTLAGGRLLELVRAFPKEQVLFQQTGATHAILLVASDGTVMASAEDIGRHNAFDKVIGQAVLKNLPVTQAVVLLSGRASFEMVFKAARLGVPLVASVSAPTSLALELAASQGITLVGFAREGRFNVYTHPQRITDLPNAGCA